MSTSQNTWLSEPKGDEKISAGTFGYINARIRQRMYDLVIKEFKQSGITQATLARRWGKAPEIVSRFLARPANWELNTIAEVLFAISGRIFKPSLETPLEQTETNVGSQTTRIKSVSEKMRFLTPTSSDALNVKQRAA
jgi:hypothetical protein